MLLDQKLKTIGFTPEKYDIWIKTLRVKQQVLLKRESCLLSLYTIGHIIQGNDYFVFTLFSENNPHLTITVNTKNLQAKEYLVPFLSEAHTVSRAHRAGLFESSYSNWFKSLEDANYPIKALRESRNYNYKDITSVKKNSVGVLTVETEDLFFEDPSTLQAEHNQDIALPILPYIVGANVVYQGNKSKTFKGFLNYNHISTTDYAHWWTRNVRPNSFVYVGKATGETEICFIKSVGDGIVQLINHAGELFTYSAWETCNNTLIPSRTQIKRINEDKPASNSFQSFLDSINMSYQEYALWIEALIKGKVDTPFIFDKEGDNYFAIRKDSSFVVHLEHESNPKKHFVFEFLWNKGNPLCKLNGKEIVGPFPLIPRINQIKDFASNPKSETLFSELLENCGYTSEEFFLPIMKASISMQNNEIETKKDLSIEDLLNKIKEEFNGLKEAENNLQKELLSLSNDKLELEKQNTELQNVIKELKAHAWDLEKENGLLKSKINGLKEDINSEA